ncbi:MAG: amino acid ABC transporter ATP-binding/permease protein [Verrucomicrobiales bacterium]
MKLSENRKRVLWFVVPVLGAGTLLLSVGLMSTSSALLAAAAERPPILDLMLFFVGVRFFGIGRAVSRYVERLASHEMVFRYLEALRVKAFKVWSTSWQRFPMTQRRGDMVQRWVSDVDVLLEKYLMVIFPFLAAVGVALVVWPIALWLNVWIGMALMAGGLTLGLVLPWLSLRLSSRYGAKRRIELGRLRTQAGAWWEGWEELQVFGAAPVKQTEIEERLGLLERQQRVLTRESGWQESAGQAVSLALQWAVLGLLVWQSFDGELSGPVLCAFFLGSVASLEGFLGLGKAALRWREVQMAERRLKPKSPGEATTGNPITTFVGQTCDSADGDLIALRAVEAGYACGFVAVRRIDLVLPRKGLVWLAGPSGSGKTSLLRVLLRQVGWMKGGYSFAGQDVAHMDAREVRSFFSVARQAATWLDMSLLENMRLGGFDLDEEVLWNELTDWDLAPRLDRGDLTEPMTDGQFSGGEYQRLTLIRAWLRPGAVLLLDEPSSGLDGDLQSRLWGRLRLEAESRLVVVASHEIEAMRPGERLVFMENGELLEQGQVEELLASGGRFAMWRSYCEDLYGS